VRGIDLLVLAVLGLYVGRSVVGHSAPADQKGPSQFAQQVDLTPLDRIAVQADGRLRSFESHAKTYMGYVSGPRSVSGQSNGFTYLDLVFRPERYAQTDLVYVKHKQVRQQILGVLREEGVIESSRAEEIMRRGLFAPALLRRAEVRSLLDRLGRDLIRTAKAVDAIDRGLFLADAGFLSDNLRVVAPPAADANTPWVSIADLAMAGGAPNDAMHARLASMPERIPGLDAEVQAKLSRTWAGLRDAWRNENASVVNAKVVTLAGLLPSQTAEVYPSAGRLAMESWYFRYGSMTWVWLLYLASVVPLLMAIIYRWDGPRSVGMVLFVLAFGFHTASVGIRWYISGRWPNTNMFEAVTTAAWFGGVGALALEYWTRKTPFKNLFAVGSAVMSMLALMAAHFLPTSLDSAINNKMAALNDVWLYIHTNMIIWSYAVIGLACVPALLLLRDRWCRVWDQGAVPKWRLLVLPIALGVANYTGYKLLMHVIARSHFGLDETALMTVTGVFAGSVMVVLFELMSARERQAAGRTVHRAASGGASAIMMRSYTGDKSFVRREQPTTGQVFDGATMVLVELAFVMLWTGTVMGAIWADHSWGRPWGWDPKEVFALNTFIIFLILIHVRLKVKDKSFWTAILAVAGFEVMMFNWIVVNFVISGLHSYA
jgi:ABC-type transport system involved in cytochrome c biogenesis permease subunit